MNVRSLERSFVMLSIQYYILLICVASVSALPNKSKTISCESVTYEFVIKNHKEVWSLPQAMARLCAKECALRTSCHSWHHDSDQTCFLHKTDPRPVNAGILDPHAKRFQFGLKSEYDMTTLKNCKNHNCSANTKCIHLDTHGFHCAVTECDNADLTSTLEYGDGLVHSVGGQAKVLCRHGYLPGTNFTSSRTCRDNGRWQPSLGMCELNPSPDCLNYGQGFIASYHPRTCVLILPTITNRNDAEMSCLSVSSTLFMADSMERNELITRLYLQDQFHIYNNENIIWIDGKKTSEPNPETVKFGNGSIRNMTGFFARQEVTGSQETCVGLDLYASFEPFKWRWLDCSRQGRGVCEHPF